LKKNHLNKNKTRNETNERIGEGRGSRFRKNFLAHKFYIEKNLNVLFEGEEQTAIIIIQLVSIRGVPEPKFRPEPELKPDRNSKFFSQPDPEPKNPATSGLPEPEPEVPEHL
jgi:hypothetical protein